MGLLRALNKIRGGYPGGWKRYARGYQGDRPPPFVQPHDPDDRRSLIPAQGLREYWYPALPAKAVGWRKPVGLRLLGTDLVFFRDAHGEVHALWDYCPHRGVYLSLGKCVWRGYLSCAYHGATFNGKGECVEFITEGPDSKMVGRLQARTFPTRTLKDMVFVWMGEGEPAPIEEDVPPELFEADERTTVFHTIRYWHCNWMIALENTLDAHNCFWVHRNAIIQLRNRFGGRPRTPLGYRTKIVNNKAAVMADRGGAANYYAKDGTIPYQMYYPRTGGYWPPTRFRLLWIWFFEWRNRQKQNPPKFETPEEWAGGLHLPSMQRLFSGGPGALYTRWCVPVEESLTRVVYFRSRRVRTHAGRFWQRLAFHLYRNWLQNYNFSDQDYDAMYSARYQYPEYLSATDSHVVAQRRLITEHARGLKRSVQVAEMTTAEQLVAEGHALLEVPQNGEQVLTNGGTNGAGTAAEAKAGAGQTPSSA
jgi:phenylpropionate dioxygenase-like ring-hydroxylating dioxygenase large terminal subunit